MSSVDRPLEFVRYRPVFGDLAEQNQRTLRILLMRLHAEQQALQYILKAISDNEISPASNRQPGSPGDRLQYYLGTACKRIFRMAPIHHHFELLGWSESKVIVRFWIMALVFALFALTTLKLR